MRPKSLAAKTDRGRASGLSMPLRARRAERARHAPSALNLTFKVYFYLSLPVVKEQPAASRAAGVEIVSGMVGAPGLEPGTSSLSEKRSNQLSYAPGSIWWSRRDSNPRHPACKAGALPAELRPPRRTPAPRESSGAIQAEHRPRLRLSGAASLQKEVIQPLVPQRLPCYDFIPVTGPTFVDCPPRGSARRLRVWSAPMM